MTQKVSARTAIAAMPSSAIKPTRGHCRLRLSFGRKTITGLLGALLLLAIRHKGDVRNILIWLAINVVFSFSVANISWQGHLGGFVAGAAATAVIVFLPKDRRNLQWPLVGLIALLGIAAIAVRALTF